VRLDSILLWGFFATVVLTTVMEGGQGLGFSRMSIPLMLGAAFTANRGRASVVGFVIHMVNGWLFALVYGLAFENLRLATWWLGALFGLAQALFVLVAFLPIFPYLHPRMASENFGPNPTRQLEPPGFMALNYGRATPAITIAAHLLYGAILGGFYTLAR
jgi:hypothetical protein